MFYKNLVRFSLAVLFVIMPMQMFAQISLEIDYGTFRYDSTHTLVELYYAIPIMGLKFVDNSSGEFQAQVMLTLEVVTGDSMWNESWRMERKLADTTAMQKADRMVDALRLQLLPGDYRLSLRVDDLNAPDNSATGDQQITVPSYSRPTLSLSDIELATSIKKADYTPDQVFWKNGMEVIPNPCLVYGKGALNLFYYLEAYHLDKGLSGDQYKNKIQITDANDQVIENIRTREQIKQKGMSSVEAGAVNISVLPSGTYYLLFSILNLQDSVLISANKKFYIYNPDVATPLQVAGENIEAALAKSEFVTMGEKQLNEEFELTQFFRNKNDKEIYTKLDGLDGKRRFLYQIWKKVDPTPNTEANEFKIEYKRRIEKANDLYRSYSRKGWKTDRGRVYILWGAPTDVERNPNNPVSYAHEIWHYDNIEGGVIFVFADFQEYGEFVQIHSTKQGENFNNNWEGLIQK